MELTLKFSSDENSKKLVVQPNVTFGITVQSDAVIDYLHYDLRDPAENLWRMGRIKVQSREFNIPLAIHSKRHLGKWTIGVKAKSGDEIAESILEVELAKKAHSKESKRQKKVIPEPDEVEEPQTSPNSIEDSTAGKDSLFEEVDEKKTYEEATELIAENESDTETPHDKMVEEVEEVEESKTVVNVAEDDNDQDIEEESLIGVSESSDEGRYEKQTEIEPEGELLKKFKELDINNDGVLTYEEVKQALKEESDLEDETTDQENDSKPVESIDTEVVGAEEEVEEDIDEDEVVEEFTFSSSMFSEVKTKDDLKTIEAKNLDEELIAELEIPVQELDSLNSMENSLLNDAGKTYISDMLQSEAYEISEIVPETSPQRISYWYDQCYQILENYEHELRMEYREIRELQEKQRAALETLLDTPQANDFLSALEIEEELLDQLQDSGYELVRDLVLANFAEVVSKGFDRNQVKKWMRTAKFYVGLDRLDKSMWT